jgi:Toprim domain
MTDFGDLMRQVAPLLGYDSSAADRKGIARYRSHGSLRIDFGKGLFADYEAGEAGGVFDLIEHATGERPCDWLQRNHISAPKGNGTARAPRARREPEDRGAERRDLSFEELERATLAREIWQQGQSVEGVTAVKDYLAARHLEIGDTSQFRFHPRTPWRAAPDAPLEHRACLLVAYRSFDNDAITGLSRILVDEPERWPKTRRMMLGVVRRAAAKIVPIADTLAVAEGIETAIAANMLGYGPAWALGSAGAVAQLPVLARVDRLVLLEENNDASRAAVDRCGRRWLRAGRKVIRVSPDQGYDDLNDELISKRNI